MSTCHASHVTVGYINCQYHPFSDKIYPIVLTLHFFFSIQKPRNVYIAMTQCAFADNKGGIFLATPLRHESCQNYCVA